MGKQERAMKREADTAAIARMRAEADAAFPSQAASDAALARDTEAAIERAKAEPVARLFTAWWVENEGWRFAVVDVPQSLVERYAVHVSEPDLKPFAMAKMYQAIEMHTSGKVVPT